LDVLTADADAGFPVSGRLVLDRIACYRFRMKAPAQKLHFREKGKPRSSARRAVAPRKAKPPSAASKKRASTDLFVELVTDSKIQWVWPD
jgi:hypothetical protein